MNKIYSFILISLFVLSCSNTKNNGDAIISLDVSSNKKLIVYSILKKGQFSLYTSDLEGQNLKPVNLQKGYSYLRPKFSAQGEKIVYIRKKVNTSENSLVILDLQTQKQDILMSTKSEFIGEAILSNDLKKVYFTKANSYQSNSPLAQSSLKGFDLYELSLLDNKIRNLTSLDAYGMGGLFEFDIHTLLINIQGSKGGIFLCSKKENNKLTKVNLKVEKDKGQSIIFYSDFQRIDKNSFVVQNNYQITRIFFDEKKVKDIYLSDDQISSLSCYNEHIYFVTSKDPLVLKIISKTGKLLKEVKLKIN